MSSSSEALFDHIADFLKFISSTQLFWFSLNTSHNHGCHLANRFCLDPNEYKVCCLLSHCPGVLSLCQPVVASPLVVPSLHRPLVVSSSCRASWWSHCLSSSSHCTALSSSSHCAALSSSCHASWLSHCLSSSSHCTTLSSTSRASLWLHHLSLSSCCAPRQPLVLSSRRLVVVSPLDAPPSCPLVVLSCRLSLSCRASWLLRHHLLSSSCCTALSSSHRAGWLLRCLSLRRPLVLSS